MEIFLCAIVAVLAAAYFLRAALRPASPAFLQKGILTREKLGYMLSVLAFSSKNTQKGRGVHVAASYRILQKAYRVIGKKPQNERFACEQTLFDNFYGVERQNASFLQTLPHVHGVPRIYAFCELFVKSKGGAVTREALESAVKAYAAETPFRFCELAALEATLKAALSEYLAIYAQKLLRIEARVARGRVDGAKKRVCYPLLSSAAYVYGYRQKNAEPFADARFSETAEREKLLDFMEKLAEYNARITAAVQSLHTLAGVFSHGFCLSLSGTDEVLRAGDPSYARLSDGTRVLYLTQIGRQAARRKCGEEALAREILLKSAKEGKDISFYILPPPKSRTAQRLYVCVEVALLAAAVVLLALFLPFLGWLYVLIGLPILASAVSVLSKRALQPFVKRRELPAYDVKTLRADEHATAILMPCYAATTGDIRDCFSRFATVMQVNREDIFSYCLLLDYAASDTPTTASDGELNECLRALYAELPPEFRARTCVLVRKRTKVKHEDLYRGYEKKRGAVMDFAAYVLRGEGEFAFKLGNLGKVKYAVTLDSDTAMYDCAALVAAKAHPYTADFAVLSLCCKAAEKNTPFARLYGGETGPGLYRHKAFEAYNDLFGVGNYTGKGIFDIALFDRRLNGFFPDNAILSHDFAEGAVAGCLAAQASASEDVPQSFGSHLSRSLRWLRGDWQLLPYLCPRVKDRSGARIKNPLPPIAKFALAENLTASLVPISQLFVLFAALFSPSVWAIALLAALPQIIRLVLALPSLWHAPREYGKELLRCLFEWAMLPTVAVYTLCAVAVTLGRLCTRRNLLEWRVFAQDKGDIGLLANPIAAVVFAATAAVFSRSLFFFAPALLFAVGGSLPALTSVRRAAEQSDALTSILYDTATRTFAYFRAQEGYPLPCDCYQEDNAVGFVPRTSPTNIGMGLLAYAAAYEIGLIDKATLSARIENQLDALEKLETYEGNLYNWYDCNTLQPLAPRFVSSVDSGNLLACLYAVRCFTGGALSERLDALIARTDLSALYDGERDLLFIGYDADQMRFTPNHYDLLGSESALTYLVGCASGKLPVSAYLALNRACVKYGGAQTLYSWTGGAFEYLMTRLFVSPPNGSLLESAYMGAAAAHRRFAKKRHSAVWGVSECRYNAFDENGGNLYRAFGVPAIAYSEVPPMPPTASYAAFLALPYTDPREAERNLTALTASVFGRYGFYEALDGAVPVKSYMTHHQGMIMAAIASTVKPNALQNRLLAHPVWRGVRLFCGEERARAHRRTMPPRRKPTVIPSVGAYVCKCGPLGVAIGKTDAIYSYRHIRLFEKFRVFAFENDARIELTAGTRSFGDAARCALTLGGLCAQSAVQVLSSPLGVSLSVTVRNLSDRDRTFRIVGCAQPILAPYADYDAHPAFSKLFIDTGGERSFVWARRRQEGVTLVFAASGADDVRYSANKREFCARGTLADFGQNTDPALCGTFWLPLAPKEEKTFSFCVLVTENAENASHIAALAALPECLLQNRGSALALSQYVPPLAKTTAGALLDGECSALPDRPDLPCVPSAVNVATIVMLADRLRAYRLLYEIGFSFRAALFCRADTSEARALMYRAEEEVEKSGVRAVGGVVDVLKKDEQGYKQMQELTALPKPTLPLACFSAQKHTFASLPLPAVSYTRALGAGGFAGDAFSIDLPSDLPPKPWSNVLSVGTMGTVMTESGGGFTFTDNARERKLTAWCNDPAEESASEFVALAEGESAWSIARLPLCAPAYYRAEHGFGYTTYTCAYNGVTATQTCFLATSDGSEAKMFRVTVENNTDTVRSLRVLFAVKPVLGDFARITRPSVDFAEYENGLRLSCGKSGMECYLLSSLPSEPIGAAVYGACEAKELALFAPHKSCAYFGVASDVCLLPNGKQTLFFTLSGTPFEADDGDEALERAKRRAQNLPKITLDGDYAELSKWLVQQVYHSRFAGRTGFYQVSGAYGFRDQLQDCLALLYVDPALVRAHLLECARHQFKAGDVQHWWHPPAVGVRTHVCDDRLWLVYTACAYVRHTDDSSIFAERVPFLDDVPIAPDDASVYAAATFSAEKDSFYEHCLRALAVVFDRGEHGLILLRGGDWLDALDRAGVRGRGESVWCTMFATRVLDLFLRHVVDEKESAALRKARRELYDAACASFCGDRFLRATTDDGTPIGAPSSPACRIDLMAQSFAVLCDIGTREQQRTALATVYRALVDKENGIVSLFDPPFVSPDGVGYLGKYPPYVRENGGQYTQAAVWFAWALFKAGETEKANEVLKLLSPVHKCATPDGVKRYGGEPYVTASDVYGGEAAGRAGWTWYTGSAAWLYKLIVEQYAGITVRGNTVSFDPHLPADTPSLTVTLRHENEKITVRILNSGEGEWRVRIGEVVYSVPQIRLRKELAGKTVTVVRLPNK